MLRLWTQRDKTASWFELEDMTRFNDAIDRALAESVARYAAGQRQSQDIFLGIIGHDLRTPLSAINLGATYLMRSEQADSKLIQLGSRMFNSAVRMQEIIDNLLDFVRSRSGAGIPLQSSDVDLSAISEQIAEEFRVSNPGAVIRTEVVGNVTGRWDGGRIAQVYQNLIGNAIQYGADGTVVSVVTREQDGQVILSVHNDGPAIPPDLLHHIFDPLRRGTPQAGNRKNLGLGLYIVREIVAAHHGTIEVTSTLEAGTTFTVRLRRRMPAG